MHDSYVDLRKFICEEVKRLQEEWWAESYDKRLFDDDSINQKSMYVPDDIKAAIKKWLKDMNL